jgi:hypothetical protein
MRKGISAVVLAASAAALTIGLTATSSFASTVKTWSVSPGGSIAMSSSKAKLKDTSTAKAVTCRSSSAKGTLKSGTGLSGTGIGSLTSMSYSTCTGPKKLAFTLTAASLPWTLNAMSYNSTKGVAHGTISGITIAVSGTGCKATVAGTSATTGGEEHIAYTNSKADLKFVPADGTLHVYAVTGCTGLFKTGDAVTLAAIYAVSPKQKLIKS